MSRKLVFSRSVRGPHDRDTGSDAVRIRWDVAWLNDPLYDLDPELAQPALRIARAVPDRDHRWQADSRSGRVGHAADPAASGARLIQRRRVDEVDDHCSEFLALVLLEEMPGRGDGHR